MNNFILKKYYLVLLLAFVLFMLFSIFRLLLGLDFSDSAFNLTKDDQTYLSSGIPITQVFVANENGLSQVIVPFKNIHLGKKDRVSLELADESCQTVLFQEEIGFSLFSSLDTREFRFPRITNSAGQKYCLKMTYLGKETKKSRLPAITTSDMTPQGFYYENSSESAPKEEMLYIRLKYSGALWQENLETLNKRMSQYKPAFMKGGYLTAIFALTVLATLGLGITLILL